MALIRDVNYIVTDVETTGPNGTKNRITEIGCVVVRGREIVDEYTSLMNPHQSIPPFIANMTGITNHMVFTAPETKDALQYVKKLYELPNAVFVAHNVHFDWSFVLESFKRNGLIMPDIPLLCTFKLAKRLFNKETKKNVGALADYFHIPLIDRHRAMGDAKATAYILIEELELLEKEYNIETIEDLLKFQNLKIAKKSNDKSENVIYKKSKNIPDYPGVYYFYDKNMKPIYIGKAKSLKARIHQHLNTNGYTNDKISEMVRKAYDISWTETANELEALILESKEIKKYQPKYNSVQKKHRNYPFIKFSDDNYPTLEIAYDIEDGNSECYGPFRSRRVAEQVLENVDKKFRLRKCGVTESPDCNSCLYYQINKCVGPEAENISKNDYDDEIEKVKHYLRSYNNGILSEMTEKMLEKANKLEYEDAAKLKRSVDELRIILNRQQDVSTSVKENNIILLKPDEESSGLIEIYFIRQGALYKHITLGKKAPLLRAFKIAGKAYYNGTPDREKLTYEEIDEMKIVNSWLYSNRDSGRYIYVYKKTQEELYSEIETNFKEM
jgi:DNA polymerase-3 subunit epsilon